MPEFNNMQQSPEQMKKMMEEMQRRENAGLTPEQIKERDRQKEMKKRKNISLINETLGICARGKYEKDGKEIYLGSSGEQLSSIRVFMPDEVAKLRNEECKDAEDSSGEIPACSFSCENADALSLALEKTNDPSYMNDNHILVLNLASDTRPGGAVHEGANGQEEDLCRRSTLLMSLQTDEAASYYKYNKALKSHLGSDGVMISPDVMVLRDEAGELMSKPYCISVMSCAAPMIRFGLEGKSDEEYRAMLQGRIEGMLCCAESMGYKNLILGAFGCGVFGNDAAVVANAFKEVLYGPVGKHFAHVDFAVLCSPGKDYNYKEFCKAFNTTP